MSIIDHPDTEARIQSERAAIEATVRDYIEGWYTGDADRMDRSLHHDLVKRIPENEETGALGVVTKEQMLELTAAGGGNAPDTDFEILVDDVSTDIATARVMSPEYLDYHHLVKVADGWKIANILFHARR